MYLETIGYLSRLCHTSLLTSQGNDVKSEPLLTASMRFCAGVPTYASMKCVPSPEYSCRPLLALSPSPAPPSPSPSSSAFASRPRAHLANVSDGSSPLSSSTTRCRPRRLSTDSLLWSGTCIRIGSSSSSSRSSRSANCSILVAEAGAGFIAAVNMATRRRTNGEGSPQLLLRRLDSAGRDKVAGGETGQAVFVFCCLIDFIMLVFRRI